MKSASDKIPSPIAARESWWRRLANIFWGNEILIVHTDGTARLWDLKDRRESLRFTVKDAAAADAAFLKVRSKNKPRTRAIVTLNTMGYVRGWTPRRNPDRTERFMKDR